MNILMHIRSMVGCRLKQKDAPLSPKPMHTAMPMLTTKQSPRADFRFRRSVSHQDLLAEPLLIESPPLYAAAKKAHGSAIGNYG